MAVLSGPASKRAKFVACAVVVLGFGICPRVGVLEDGPLVGALVAVGMGVGSLHRSRLLVKAVYGQLAALVYLAGESAAGAFGEFGERLASVLDRIAQFAGAGGEQFGRSTNDVPFAVGVFVVLWTVSGSRRWASRLLTAALISFALLVTGRIIAELLAKDDRWPPTLLIAATLRAGVLLPGLLRRDRADPRADSSPTGKWTWALGGTTAVAIIVAAAGDSLVFRDRGTQRVVVLERGLVEWSVANYTEYHDFAIGMFGELERYLAIDGFRLERGFKTEELTDEALRGVDVLVSVNNGVPWTSGEVPVINRFMECGGTALFLCDHTNVAGQLPVANEVCAPHGIRLNFDAAFPLGSPGWHGSIRGLRHPATMGVPPADFRHSVGASLTLSGAATPILVGRFALADEGVESNAMGAYLGNYHHDAGERRGDLVVAAEARAGRGRLIVFGDTSAFQNAAMAKYGGFQRGLLFHAAGRVELLLDETWPLFAVSLLAVVGIALLGTERRSAVWSAAVVFGLLAGHALYQAHLGTHRRAAPSQVARPTNAVLLEDSSGRYSPDSEAMYRIVGQGELQTALLRNGCLVYAGTIDEQPFVPRLVIIDNPAGPLSEHVADRLTAYVRDGGSVLVACGHDRAGNVAALLRVAGIRVTNRTLAGLPEDPGIAYGVAWRAPRFVEPWALEAERAGARSLVRIGEADVVMSADVGRGRFLVVGDPRFLQNSNLDVRINGTSANHRLLAQLLELGGVELHLRKDGK
jgi:hypothetical protein